MRACVCFIYVSRPLGAPSSSWICLGRHLAARYAYKQRLLRQLRLLMISSGLINIKDCVISCSLASRAIALLFTLDSSETPVFSHVQGSAKRLRPGLVNFINAVAYHFCLSLPAAFTQPGRSLLADPCISMCIWNIGQTVQVLASVYFVGTPEHCPCNFFFRRT